MAIGHCTRLICGFLVLFSGSAVSAQAAEIRWVPCLSSDVEGINFSLRGFSDEVIVRIEGEVNGGPLRTVTVVVPLEYGGFTPAPIADLKTYRITRLTVWAGGRQRVLTVPERGQWISVDR